MLLRSLAYSIPSIALCPQSTYCANHLQTENLAREIQELCRLIIATHDEVMLITLCEKLRDRLHEHNRQTNDMASETLARLLESEARLKKAS
jgi:hypothetical protein